MQGRLVKRIVGPRLLRRMLPTSLFGRSLLIIILPIALMQIAVTFAFFLASEDQVNSQLSDGLAGEIAAISSLYRDTPERLPELHARAQEALGLSVSFRAEPLPRSDRVNFFRSLDRTLRQRLTQRLDGQPFSFDTTRYFAYIDIRVGVPGGHLKFLAPRERAFADQGPQFIAWLAGATLILTAVAVLFIRNQVRAIERLAEAATAFGRGGDISSFKPHGAREVREAAAAFIAMKDNIQRHLEQRTALLASVSHDLRTPLTRLKLELALSEPGKRNEAMKQDLAEMEHMIDEYLDFARGEGGEQIESVPLMSIVQSVAEGARRTGAEVKVEGDAGLVARVRPNALRRALANLTGNAAAYADRVRITLEARENRIDIIVDDDGPGIDLDRRDEAFKPFNRLDESRNQNEKGVGLGLAIARDVARAHGGDVALEDSPLGGLRATISLPA
jgi:two-component system, OmpR family, osmolarity sensor histidine kinase EnvZ